MTRLSTLRSALARMSVRLVLQQIGLALLVFLLYALWLHVPDASALDVIGSALLALLVVAVAGVGESALVLHVAGRARTPERLLRGALLLLAGAVLWFGWNALLEHLRGNYNSNDALWAGYLNSRFPHQLRNVFSYQHILSWLRWMWTMLGWIGAGLVASGVFAGTASVRPLRAAGCALRSITYWAALLVGTMAATAITGALVNWTPGHGLRVEMLSLVLRLAAAALVDAAVACLVLAILAACVHRSDEAGAPYSTPAGTPVASQPRTVDNP
jgi:hypothetical protein